ncbi:prephenate dehydratase, partial [bacterium]|nr:prephenate dehydratase [bacterium]
NKHNLNLIYLESRPSRKVFGEYNFFADVDKGEDEIKDALFEIQKECNFYKLLGSYGRIDNF